MKVIALAISVLITLQSPPASTQQQTARCRIEGIVVKTGSNEPLANAQLTLIRAMASPEGMPIGSLNPPPPSPIPSVTTDGQGRFLFADITPGSYRIAAAHNGYARQEYGQRLFGAHGTVLHLAAGQVLKDVVFALTPAGNISGQVRDPAGQPIAGMQVQLLRSAYNPNGQKSYQAAGSGRTNDRGEYRLYWITPGRYVLSVSSNRLPGMIGGGGSPNEVAETTYPLTYYPGTLEATRAATIEVQPGVELNAIDVTLPAQPLYHVKGRLIDSTTGQAPKTANVSMAPRQSIAPFGPWMSARQSYDGATGTFDLRDVASGSYWLRANVSDPNAPLPEGLVGRPMNEVMSVAFAANLATQAAVEVNNSDVEGLVLTLTQGISIPGRLGVESQQLSSLAGLDRLRVTLRPTTPGPGGMRQPLQRIGADGSYTIDNVFPGEYRVVISPLPPGVYVKEARLGNMDALNQPLMITGPVSDSLDVVLSSKAGRITGKVVDSHSQPVSGIQAVVIPERIDQRIDLYKTAVTDVSGGFAIQGVAPGNYRVMAWEAIEPFAYFDPDFMRQYEGKGKVVHVTESSAETVEVPVIPTGN